MSPTTPNFAIPYPSPADAVKNGATDMQAIADRLDLVLPGFVPKSLVDGKGELIVATAADTVGRLPAGANGFVLTADAAQATGVKWQAPAAGGELAYVQATAAHNITATAAGAATTVLTAPALTLDGATPILIAGFFPAIACPTVAASATVIDLYDGGTIVGRFITITNPVATQLSITAVGEYALTPSAGSHTYSLRAWATSTSGTPRIEAGAGGAGAYQPMFLRIFKR